MRVNPLEADEAFAARVERLRAGEPARVMDLFSGCGGISLGFLRAGFRIVGAVENDPFAAMSHAMNFHGTDAATLALHGKSRDITQVDPEDLCREFGLGPADRAVDVLVGGPPCQAYARIGRAKLRKVRQHPQAYRLDPRGDLYLTYLRWVDRLRPLVILMENVPDMLNQGGENVAAAVVQALTLRGYVAGYGLLNAAFHGVPQMRDRVFILAYRRELGITPALPAPTRHLELPVGYQSARSMVLKYADLLSVGTYLHVRSDPALPGPVTAEEAIGDLPVISGDDVRRGRRVASAGTFLPYRTMPALSPYAQAMREWPGFEGGAGVSDHFIRFLPRDGRIFEAMREGDEYPAALEIAERLFAERVKAERRRKGGKPWEALRKAMVPPYNPATFPNRWWKLVRDTPCRTLMAHLGKDCYSHIHYDGSQRRTISVREAARLQSFPDGFRFAGSMNHAYRQIGNAVPPVLALEIAGVVKQALRDAVTSLTAADATGRFGGNAPLRSALGPSASR